MEFIVLASWNMFENFSLGWLQIVSLILVILLSMDGIFEN